MYRPEGWQNPHPYKVTIEHDERLEGFVQGRHEIFEAGADAMLVGLTSQEHQDWLATPEGESRKGKWVFIPDD